jgi:hypothetical protein
VGSRDAENSEFGRSGGGWGRRACLPRAESKSEICESGLGANPGEFTVGRGRGRNSGGQAARVWSGRGLGTKVGGFPPAVTAPTHPDPEAKWSRRDGEAGELPRLTRLGAA